MPAPALSSAHSWSSRSGLHFLVVLVLEIVFLFQSATQVKAECYFKLLNSGAEVSMQQDNGAFEFLALQEMLYRNDNSGGLQSAEIRMVIGRDGHAGEERPYKVEVGTVVDGWQFTNSRVADQGTLLLTPDSRDSTQQITFQVNPGETTNVSIMRPDGEDPDCVLQLTPPTYGDPCSFAQTCVGNIQQDGVIVQANVTGTQVCPGWITGHGDDSDGLFCEADTIWGDTTFEDCTQCNYCGNNECNPGEGENYCPEDCPDGPLTVVRCGNNICEATENHDSCPEDCDPNTAQCFWDPIDNTGDSYFFKAIVPQPFEQGGLSATFGCYEPGTFFDIVGRILSDSGIGCGGLAAYLYLSANPLEVPMPATAPVVGDDPYVAFGSYYSGIQLFGLDREQIFNVVKANAAKNCAGDTTKQIVETILLSRVPVGNIPVRGLVRAPLQVGRGGAEVILGGGAIVDAAKTAQIIAQDASVEEQSQLLQNLGGCVNDVLDNQPMYRGKVLDHGREICHADLDINISFDLDEISVTPTQTNKKGLPYNYCKQVPFNQRADCRACMGEWNEAEKQYANEKEKIFTAVGCVRVSGSGLAADLIKLMLGVGGGVSLLSFLSAAFKLTTSQGDTTKVKEAKELLTASVSGLLFIIFSVIILEFLGVQILHIPGLG